MRPLFFLAAPALLLGLGYLQVARDPEIQETRALANITEQQRARAIIAADGAAASRQTAHERYTSGVCLRTERITQGQRFQSVPPGTILCDRHGWTAQVDQFGNVTHLAYTDDQDAIMRLWW
jgi:hypothetical protein